MYGKTALRDCAAVYTHGTPEFELNSSPQDAPEFELNSSPQGAPEFELNSFFPSVFCLMFFFF